MGLDILMAGQAGPAHIGHKAAGLSKPTNTGQSWNSDHEPDTDSLSIDILEAQKTAAANPATGHRLRRE